MSLPEVAATPRLLSDEDVLGIVFDSFEISQGDVPCQARFLELVVRIFPTVQFPATPEAELVSLFVERTQNFLTDGHHHEQQTRSMIRNQAEIHITYFRDRAIPDMTRELASQTEDENETVLQSCLRNMVSALCRHDLKYLSRTKKRVHSDVRSKSVSYLKRYCIDEQLPKNPYTQAVLLGVTAKLHEVLADEIVGRKLREDIQALARLWEWDHPGERFWQKTGRRGRS